MIPEEFFSPYFEALRIVGYIMVNLAHTKGAEARAGLKIMKRVCERLYEAWTGYAFPKFP